MGIRVHSFHEMKITLQEDLSRDTEFYYHHQFKIYQEPYLIWDRETWEGVLAICTAYRIEVNGMHAGDLILEEKGRGVKYIVDFSVLPEYQGRGVGKAVLRQLMKMGQKFTAITREETLRFFLKSGFVLERALKSYYCPEVDGYFITYGGKTRHSRRQT